MISVVNSASVREAVYIVSRSVSALGSLVEVPGSLVDGTTLARDGCIEETVSLLVTPIETRHIGTSNILLRESTNILSEIPIEQGVLLSRPTLTVQILILENRVFRRVLVELGVTFS